MSLGDIRSSNALDNVANSFYMYSLDAFNLITENTNYPNLPINSATYIDSIGDLKSSGPMTNGQILIGGTGVAPSKATLTAGVGGNIVITNASNSISLSTTPTPAFTDIKIDDTTIDSIIPTAPRTYTLPDVGKNSTFVLSDSIPQLNQIAGWTVHQGFVTSTINGDNSVFTVPTGRKALIMNYSLYNPNGGSVTFFASINISGTVKRITSNGTLATLTRNGQTSAFCFNAGEQFIINTNLTTCSIQCGYITFPSSVPINSVRIDVNSTPTALLTATTTTYSLTSVLPPTMTGIQWFIVNGTGGTLVYTTSFTPNAGVNATISTNSVATLVGIAPLLSIPMFTGDSLLISSAAATAGQFAFATIWTP